MGLAMPTVCQGNETTGPRTSNKESTMKYGARNAIAAKVKSIKKGDVMSLVKFEITTPAAMASVLTTESLDEMGLNPGDKILLVVKAIHVLPVKE
jgi:molybdate transport system regulatory protein